MRDRAPTVAGRVKLTTTDGTTSTSYILTMDDAPTEEGTPLNKASLLTDQTAAKMGFTEASNPTPNDMFSALADASADANSNISMLQSNLATTTNKLNSLITTSNTDNPPSRLTTGYLYLYYE